MKNRTVNDKQKNVAQKINNLIKSEKEVINENKTIFDKKGKYPLSNLSKINHLAKFILKENRLSLSPKNIKIAEYDVTSKADMGVAIIFILPDDEQYIESKNGRQFQFKIQDFVEYLDHHLPNATQFHSKDHYDDNEVTNYFDFELYWGNLDERNRIDDIRNFVTQTINTTGLIPELT